MSLIHAVAGFIASTLARISIAASRKKLAAFAHFNETSQRKVDHNIWDSFLTRYVKETRDGRLVIEYCAVSPDCKAHLKGYLSALQQEDPTTLSKDEAFVYWVNLYNALTVNIVLDYYPIKSIRDIHSGIRPGPWQRKLAKVRGIEISLDNIEHGILRAFWRDNRIHYAVNCASVGCPNLMSSAFRAVNLDETLDQLAQSFITHSRGVAFNEEGQVIVSSIYNWFKADFGGDDGGVIAHLSLYADQDTKQKLGRLDKIAHYSYDWTLNDAI